MLFSTNLKVEIQCMPRVRNSNALIIKYLFIDKTNDGKIYG